jgi:hypothetical protein
MRTTLVQQNKLTECLAPAADAAGRTGDYIDVSGCRKAYIICHITQGNAATILLSPLQATSAAAAGSKVLANVVAIWSNLDTAASDTLVRRTDAVNYTTDAGVKNKIVVFEIDTSLLDINNGFKYISMSTGASNAANITQAMFQLADMRFEQPTPDSVID